MRVPEGEDAILVLFCYCTTCSDFVFMGRTGVGSPARTSKILVLKEPTCANGKCSFGPNKVSSKVPPSLKSRATQTTFGGASLSFVKEPHDMQAISCQDFFLSKCQKLYPRQRKSEHLRMHAASRNNSKF